MNTIYERKLQQYTSIKGGAETILHQGQEDTNELSFEISFENETNGYFAELILGDNNNFVFADERLIYDKK